MKLALLALAAAAMIASASAAPLTEEQYQFLFTKFSQQYGKSYETNDVFGKYATFKKNVDLIVAHNARGESFKMGINQFADMTKAEYSSFLGLKKISKKSVKSNSTLPHIPGLDLSTPTVRSTAGQDIDWVAKGVVNKVKDQGQCGSCWAFSTLGALEPAVAIATGQLKDFAEQQLVDCAGGRFSNEGCNGGLMSAAFDYIMATDGANNKMALTADYKYTARDGKCKADSTANTPVNVQKYNPASSEESIINELQKGPIAVAIAADSMAFQFYSSGILHAKDCTGQVDHGVVAVAYQSGATPYFNIRNSWGSSWGDKGYVKFAVGESKTGTCAIASGDDSDPFNVRPVINE